MGIGKERRDLVLNGNTKDGYTRKKVQDEIIPKIKEEIADLKGANEACKEKGLGPMMDEDIEEVQGWLELAEKRWNV